MLLFWIWLAGSVITAIIIGATGGYVDAEDGVRCLALSLGWPVTWALIVGSIFT